MATTAADDERAPRVRRPDVDGLRAIAVVLVVAFHAGVRGLGGGYVGVDVFYVISGFLITGLLHDELARTGTLSLGRFYARRARRLLPAAAVALVAIAIGVEIFTAPVYRPSIRLDAVAAALLYANWQFALESVNYLGLGAAQNPVLHFWSLSVEEQFYLAWPALLLAAARLRRFGSLRLRLAVAVGAVGVASLAWSIATTPAQPAIAYFETTSRAFELAAGGALALAAPWLARLRPRLAALLGIGGVAAIVAAALLDGPTTAFPGTAALLPVAGAAAVLAAGVAAPRSGAGALLASGPLGYVGRVSYSWYLWHWPCLVFAGVAAGAASAARPDAARTAAVVAVSFALAVASYHLVEQRVRAARWLDVRRRGPAFAAALTGLALLAVGIAGGPLGRPGSPFAFVVPALATAGTGQPMTALDAAASTPYAAMRGCHAGYGATAPPAACAFGDVRARQTVVLVGDSHAAMWFPPLESLARRQRFRLVAFTKSGCPLAGGLQIFLPAIGRDYTECAAWQRAVLARIAALRPSLVIVGRTSTYLPQVLAADGDRVDARAAAALWGAGVARTYRALARGGARVLLLRDPPRPPFDVPACISWDADAAARCAFRRGPLPDAAQRAAELAAGVPARAYVDTTPVACPLATCPAVVGGLVTYRDDNHLTAAFAASRWRQLAAALDRALARPV